MKYKINWEKFWETNMKKKYFIFILFSYYPNVRKKSIKIFYVILFHYNSISYWDFFFHLDYFYANQKCYGDLDLNYDK